MLFGASRSPLIVLAVPVAVLTGVAFAAPIAAFTATQRTPDRFAALFRFGITPLFLFSGTFFPIESLPSFLQPVAWLSPLWHGVDGLPRADARHDRRRAAPRGGARRDPRGDRHRRRAPGDPDHRARLEKG